MLIVRNRKNQPFTFNLKDGKTIYLGPRETGQITADVLSDELRGAAQKGLVEISESPAESPSRTDPEPAANETVADDGTSSKRRK